MQRVKKRRTFLLGDSDRLRSPCLQRCATHSSGNFISIFSTEKAISILARGKRRRTRATYSSSETQLYTIKSLLLSFRPKEGTRSCVTRPLWISSGRRQFLSPAYCGSAGIINSGRKGLIVYYRNRHSGENHNRPLPLKLRYVQDYNCR